MTLLAFIILSLYFGFKVVASAYTYILYNHKHFRKQQFIAPRKMYLIGIIEHLVLLILVLKLYL